MSSLPGLISLLLFLLVRPFDFVPSLSQFPALYVFFGLALLGFLSDLFRGRLKWVPTRALWWAIGFMLWAIVTVAFKAPDRLWGSVLKLSMTVSVYFLLAHGTPTFRSLSALAGAVLASTLVIGAVCVNMGRQPFQCIYWTEEQSTSEAEEAKGTPDGHSCATVADCRKDPVDPQFYYKCERIGAFGFSSTGNGRVRYVGFLHDPNEAAMAACAAIPLAIARYQRKRSIGRWLVVALAVVLAAATAVLSQSRGGQVVFLTVFLVYFVRRLGIKGLVIALVMSLPVLLYGGRGGEEAGSSTASRLECADAGINMFLQSPLMGVGYGQFTEYFKQTAHNSFLLAPAELGVVGMVLWGMMVWISIKICWVPLNTLKGPESEEARNWALALLTWIVSMCAGILFLSFNYHFLLWILFGLVGAYYGVLARERPELRLRVGLKDVALVAFANLALIAVLFIYIRIVGAK
jgi:hypothetical protein